MWVIFVARMSNVLSTLSPVCTGLKDTSVGTTIIIKIGDLNRCARNSVRATYLWHTVYVSARNARSSDDRDRREVWLTLQLASCNSAFDKYSLHELGICGDELVVTRHRLAGCLWLMQRVRMQVRDTRQSASRASYANNIIAAVPRDVDKK